MSGFENFAREAAELELELERKGIALGIDWNDPVQLRLLAREAIDCTPADIDRYSHHPDSAARIGLFGVAQLMLKVMTDSAELHIHSHGGFAWKAFARALWAELEARGVVTERGRDPADSSAGEGKPRVGGG